MSDDQGLVVVNMVSGTSVCDVAQNRIGDASVPHPSKIFKTFTRISLKLFNEQQNRSDEKTETERPESRQNTKGTRNNVLWLVRIGDSHSNSHPT